MKRKLFALFLTVLTCFSAVLSSCQKENTVGTDYSLTENWAYLENVVSEKEADVFFINPTTYKGDKSSFNMPLDDSEAKEKFVAAINMEKGIYDGNCRFFAPFYRQASLSAYELKGNKFEGCIELAYQDVKAAFLYYIQNYNNGRPIVLAGFSQGADLCIRLLKDCFRDLGINELLVACYAIGWRITETELEEYPHLEMALSETDTGVIISFNSEAESVTDSLIIPAGTRTYSINPLNWRVDGTPADKTLNKGACFTNSKGEIKSEIANLTGAYIDMERGALKLTDIRAEDYPSGLSLFEDGVFHLYDYQFFYRNLQENVLKRIDAYLQDKPWL